MISTFDDIAIYGRKTFFIEPSKAFLTESSLESFLIQGYECYIIRNDAVCPLQTKVELLIAHFPGALLFFDTTVQVPGIDWRVYLTSLQQQYGDKVDIGVFYDKMLPEAERSEIKAFFTDKAHVSAGCIGLKTDASYNFERIARVLKKCRANGRRAAVRIGCDETSAVSFVHNIRAYNARVTDISITHFACELEDSALSIPIYEKFKDASFVINGMKFTSDVVLILRRARENSSLCIFMFIEKNGLAGLEEDLLDRLSPKLYDMVAAKGNAMLKEIFKTGA